jgi:lipopolysaccharide export system protein LptA
MNQTFAFLMLAAAAALAAAPAAAERADRDKPMNVEADALRYDELRQTSVFTGNVVVSKGTIVIRGARVEVRQDPEGYQFGVVTAAAGQRAFWRQKREGVDEFMEGEARTIEYDGRADRVKFIGDAQMRRLRGGTPTDEVSGSLITYDNTSEVFTVDGGKAGAGPAAGSGRVRATLAPRNAASAPAPAAPGPATRLRPSSPPGGEAR